MCDMSFMKHVCNFGYRSQSSILLPNPFSIICQNITHLFCFLFCLFDLLWPLHPSVHVCLLAFQLTLSPAQQLLIQQAQAQILAAAVHHSASQQNSTTGASISASAATPITQLPLSQPIQIAPVRHNHACTSIFAVGGQINGLVLKTCVMLVQMVLQVVSKAV